VEFRASQQTVTENKRLRRDLRQAKLAIWCLVKQCGGTVDLSLKDLREAGVLTIICESDRLIRLVARERSLP
jgi:hypothetical protein